MVQGELETLTSTQNVDIQALTDKINTIDTILDGDDASNQSTVTNIIALINANTTAISNLDTRISTLENAGVAGASAYEVAVANGFVGTETQWLATLEGPQGQQGVAGQDGSQGIQGVAGQDGVDGQDGASAYELWLANGNTGSQADFLASLVGADGADGQDGSQGVQGVAGQDGQDGVAGATGSSAYEAWLAAGNAGTEAQFLASLVGADGQDGVDGVDGQDGVSAYAVAVANGFVGTEAEWLASLHGQDADQTVVDGKVDKSEVTALLTGVEALVATFKTGMATGKAARLAGTCDQLGGGSTGGGTGGL